MRRGVFLRNFNRLEHFSTMNTHRDGFLRLAKRFRPDPSSLRRRGIQTSAINDHRRMRKGGRSSEGASSAGGYASVSAR